MSVYELYSNLQSFAFRIIVAISIEAAGLLPPRYDALLRKDEYGSVELDPRMESEPSSMEASKEHVDADHHIEIGRPRD